MKSARFSAERQAIVSVITPCFDAAPFVGATIDAVAAQTYPAVEHVVVDDASSDGSWAIVERSRHRVTGIRLPTNRGGSHARNRGVELARGEYLMFLDADDLIEPGTIAALVAALRDRPGAVAICPWQRLRLADGEWVTHPAEVPFPPPPDALHGWLEGKWVPTCSVLWHRDAYARTGGWDEELAVNQDGDLMMRALARGVRLVVAASGVGYYRAYGAGRVAVSTGTYSEPWLRGQARVLEKVESELERQGRLANYADAIGRVYRQFGLLASTCGHPELAGECLRRSERHAGRLVSPRTGLGRLLAGLLGVERKERIAMALARRGIMTRERRRFIGRHRPPAERPRAPSSAGARERE